MDELRISLLVIGVLVVVVIGVMGWRRSRQGRDEGDMGHADDVLLHGDIPTLDDAIDDWEIRPITARHEAVVEVDDSLKGMSPRETEADIEVEKPAPRKHDDMLVVLTLLAKNGRQLKGTQIFRVMAINGLKLSERNIFELGTGGELNQTLFGVANILEPGYFDSTQSDTLSTPGLAMFMTLPGALDGETALERLLGSARRIAGELDAVLCNGKREPLGDAEIEQLRTQVSPFQPLGL